MRSDQRAPLCARPKAAGTWQATTVSWDDVQRGTVGGKVSCYGSHITDSRLTDNLSDSL